MRDPQLKRNVHRSQNQIESYHQLRSVITQVSGKKHLIGHTDWISPSATSVVGYSPT
ncbi:MAG: hypothetical protein H7240_00025 [Glaciimonas sp.]|nr:hypothetical protein [Glaciimonas sp.]